MKKHKYVFGYHTLREFCPLKYHTHLLSIYILRTENRRDMGKWSLVNVTFYLHKIKGQKVLKSFLTTNFRPWYVENDNRKVPIWNDPFDKLSILSPSLLQPDHQFKSYDNIIVSHGHICDLDRIVWLWPCKVFKVKCSYDVWWYSPISLLLPVQEFVIC